MENLNQSSKNLSRIIPNILIGLILLFAFLGFVDATYLAAKKYLDSPLNCFIFSGCDTVSKSSYSTFFGIPLSVFGIGYYLSIIFLAIAYLDSKKNIYMKIAFYFSIIGFIMSINFMLIQIFLIKAICLYCFLSFVFSAAIFLACLYVKRKYLNNNDTNLGDNAASL